MRFERPLVEGILLARRWRFFADVRLADGTQIVAHCTNTGRMTSCCEPGRRVWVSPRDPASKARLRWTWELIEMDAGLVGVNTARPNALVEEGLLANRFPELEGYVTLYREVAYGENSRIDVLLEGAAGLCYVEVKNVSLCEGGVAMFPDAVSERAQKHLVELTEMVRQDHRAVMFYAVNRGDARAFSVADHVDPDYGIAYRKARKAGVESVAYRIKHTPRALSWGARVPIEVSAEPPARVARTKRSRAKS